MTPVEDIERRFADSNSTALSQAEIENAREAQGIVRAAILDLADAINRFVPECRSKSLAMTALEDVQMRANRAIFGNQF